MAQKELDALRSTMLDYLAGTFVYRQSTGERRQQEYDCGMKYYASYTNMELLEEYGMEKWKAGQDSMSGY